MKTIKNLSFIILTSVFLSSCGFHAARVANINNNMTNVELRENNFKVVERVRGKSTATYIFGIGGLSNKSLIEKAKVEMLENANLIGQSKAIINLTTEGHTSMIFPFYYRRTVTVSAHIIEFYNPNTLNFTN